MSDKKPLRRGVDGICARSACECEREGLGDQCVWLKPADRQPAPGCRTHEGCAENGCLGWCDEHEPPTRGQKMREAGYRRRPSANNLPSDE